jgi:hypothetical protein
MMRHLSLGYISECHSSVTVSSQSELSELVTSYEREIVAAEAREQSEVEPGVQKNTRGRPVRI